VLKDVRTKLNFPFVFCILYTVCARNLVFDIKGRTPTGRVREKRVLRAEGGPETEELNMCKRKWQ